jgi:predicted ester cyclase
MPVDGFSQRWKDFPDYILGITKEIWEDRGVSTLHHYYADDIVVRTPSAVTLGNGTVINATLATLAEMPDRTLMGQDVIWCGDATVGFLSSHRSVCSATHLADGYLGQATGKRIHYRVIADCAALQDKIYDEWLVRDNGAIVRCLGIEPKTFAATLIAREGGPDAASRPFHPQRDVQGRYTSRGNDHPVGQRYAHVISQMMAADMAIIGREYDRAVESYMPGGVDGHGREAVDAFWLRLRSAFPDAAFEIHHVIGRDDPEFSPRAALRWSLTGKHAGWGAFGAPSGAEVHVMGLSHAEFGPWGLRREWVMIDEIAIWKQILLHTG